MAYNHIDSIPRGKKVRVIRYHCPYCDGEAITKKNNPKACSICTRRFCAQKPKVVAEAWL